MVETVLNRYDKTFVFFGKKVVKHGDRYAVYIPNELAKHILANYDGYVDIAVMIPTVYPKMPDKETSPNQSNLGSPS